MVSIYSILEFHTNHIVSCGFIYLQYIVSFTKHSEYTELQTLLCLEKEHQQDQPAPRSSVQAQAMSEYRSTGISGMTELEDVRRRSALGIFVSLRLCISLRIFVGEQAC